MRCSLMMKIDLRTAKTVESDSPNSQLLEKPFIIFCLLTQLPLPLKRVRVGRIGWCS